MVEKEFISKSEELAWIKASIDRIEGDKAVVVLPGTFESIVLPLKYLPKETKEDMWIEFFIKVSR